MEKAVLLGPFVGEMYWEAGRFAPMLPYLVFKKYKNRGIKFIILTREERFDLYGRYADILIPLKIEGDYITKSPNCFRLNGLKPPQYDDIVNKFKEQYSKRFKIIEHIHPDVTKGKYLNKNQFPAKQMMFKFKPRMENYELVNSFIPNEKPLVILAPRFRKGFRRNWTNWKGFYDKLSSDQDLMENFNFVICGKVGEYVPDEKNRFYDMTKIEVGKKSSTIGLLLAIMERTIFTFGSQSAIPNISLLYGIEVLEFGCQKTLHTKTYNVKNTPITFIEDRQYNIEVPKIYKHFKKLIQKKKGETK